MTTIKEIAKACGVSVATVSYILNGKGKASAKTTELVLKTAKEMHYTPNAAARQLKTKKTKNIGVIVEDMTIFSIPDVVDGITDYCERMDYQILLINLRLFKKYNDTYYYEDWYYDKLRENIRKLLNMQVAGIIYVAAHERILKCLPEDIPVPTVMAYGYTQSKKIPSVVVDDVSGAFSVMENLIQHGHRRIGVITGKPDSLHAQARLMGLQKALYQYHVPFLPQLVVNGDWERASGYAHMDELLRENVTAIFCMNDLMAGGVYDRLDELHIKAGTDISVAGYDDRMLSSYYKPPLTTVRLPLHDIGYKASEVVLGMLNGEIELENEPLVCSVPCNLVERASVADIRGTASENEVQDKLIGNELPVHGNERDPELEDQAVSAAGAEPAQKEILHGGDMEVVQEKIPTEENLKMQETKLE